MLAVQVPVMGKGSGSGGFGSGSTYLVPRDENVIDLYQGRVQAFIRSWNGKRGI